MRSLLDFFEEFAPPANTMGVGEPVAPIGDAIGSGDVVSDIPSSKIEKAKRKRKSKSSSSKQSPVRRP